MINKQGIALYTLARREISRMIRIASQVFLPPLITTTLYFLIFGSIIGQRIGSMNGVSYMLFITPGLILMSVITNAYSNVSSSLFTMRFQKSIEEILVSPLKDSFILLGYVLGGVFRGVVVGVLVFFMAHFFLDIHLYHIWGTILVVILVALIFSLAGFTNALLARNFDDIMIIPTFVLTPLTYLGGVFYSIHALPPSWQSYTYFNPIFHMVNLMRYAVIGKSEFNLCIGIAIIAACLIAFIGFNLYLLKKGVGLRD